MGLNLHAPIISFLMPSVKQISDVFPYQNPVMELTFGERLKSSRKAAKLSQTKVAAMVGVSQGLISDLENNAYDASAKTIELAYIFRVNPYWLATGKGDRNDMPMTRDESDMLHAFRLLPVEQQGVYRMHILGEAKIRGAITVSRPSIGKKAQ